MEKPLKYIAQGESYKVCFLRRAIYELKHSPHTWFTKCSGLLFAFCFTSYDFDPIVLTKKSKGSLFILVVYVNNILLVGSNDTSIYSSTLVSMTLRVLNTLLELSLHIMPLTCFKRQDFLSASRRPHLWKLARNLGIILLHSLRMLIAIEDYWAS